MLEKYEEHDALKINILLIGDSGVGKTKILQTYSGEPLAARHGRRNAEARSPR